jgi:hypothetical protein
MSYCCVAIFSIGHIYPLNITLLNFPFNYFSGSSVRNWIPAHLVYVSAILVELNSDLLL